jgi:cell filamentation protein
MYFGYNKRTGKRGDYKYWYVDKSSNKYYECIKPSDHVVKIFPRLKNHPPANQIMLCPWLNIQTKNHELIETKEGVLYNKGGIVDKKEIDYFENVHFMILVHELIHEITPLTNITVAMIKRWHQRFFGQLYTWAGKYRTVDISKSGFRWPSYNRIENAMRELDRNYMSNTPIESNIENEIISAVSQIMGEILFINPFREGNGRIAKLVGGILFFQKDYPLLDFSNIPRNEWIDASLDAYAKNYKPLSLLLGKALKIE